MAHFRGTLKGYRGQVSRWGSKDSGLYSNTASWEGSVSVSLWYNEKAKCDYASVALSRHCGAGTQRQLYYGPVSGEPEPKE